MVISIAVGIVSMIMIFVIPKFETIFKDFHTELPGITQVLLAISRLVRQRIRLGLCLASPDRLHR